jgi:glycosyltransferase involved in cell wall biosynthesis
VLDSLADERMTVFRQDHNVGPIANWNACLAAANGTFVIMLSDDDALEPKFLERCASVIADDPSLPVVVGLGGVTDSQAALQKPAVKSRSLKSGVCAGSDLLMEFLRTNISPQMCTVAMRTRDVRARGGFPDGWPHLGDLAMWVPLLLYGKAGFVNESCGSYCSHEATQTTNLPLERRLEDFGKLGELILNEARSRVADASIRKAIKRLTRRYVARNSVCHIGLYRRSGASRRTVARATWAHRDQLSALRTGDLRAMVWPLALVLLPLRWVDPLARTKRIVQRASVASHEAGELNRAQPPR